MLCTNPIVLNDSIINIRIEPDTSGLPIVVKKGSDIIPVGVMHSTSEDISVEETMVSLYDGKTGFVGFKELQTHIYCCYKILNQEC